MIYKWDLANRNETTPLCVQMPITQPLLPTHMTYYISLERSNQDLTKSAIRFDVARRWL